MTKSSVVLLWPGEGIPAQPERDGFWPASIWEHSENKRLEAFPKAQVLLSDDT